jgi:hypothetical protein
MIRPDRMRSNRLSAARGTRSPRLVPPAHNRGKRGAVFLLRLSLHLPTGSPAQHNSNTDFLGCRVHLAFCSSGSGSLCPILGFFRHNKGGKAPCVAGGFLHH